MLGLFAKFIMNDGFYWAAMFVGLAAVYMSDNRVKASIYAYAFDYDFELIYFDAQGRAQPIRYLFNLLNVDFVDTRLSREEWAEIKASEKYGKGTQLPLLVNRKTGEVKNQSKSILNFLCEEFGLVPFGSEGRYEQDWFFDTKEDFEKKPGARDAIFTEDASYEVIDFTIENYSAFLDKLNSRWSDGRKHIAGNNVSAADLTLLTFYTGIITNKNGRNPEVSRRLSEKLDQLEHTTRVINNIKSELSGAVDKLPATKS